MAILSLANRRPLLSEPAIRLLPREWRFCPKVGRSLSRDSMLNEEQVLGSRFERSNVRSVGGHSLCLD